MEIEFDTTIDDIAEHRFQIYTQGPSYKKNRWFGVIGSFLGVGIVFLLLNTFSSASMPLWFPILLGGIGAVGYLFFYSDITRKKIKKVLTEKLGSELPCPATYTIKDGQISCTSFKIDNVSFKISELLNFNENDRFIELSFGPKDLWLIPKRAFDSEEEINQFKQLLNSK